MTISISAAKKKIDLACAKQGVKDINLRKEIALKFLEENHGEFKSIRVVDEFRKKGYGIKILEHLITEAKKLKIKKLSLETGSGDFFIPARALFKKLGFAECDPFAHYKEDPNSCYMSLEI